MAFHHETGVLMHVMQQHKKLTHHFWKKNAHTQRQVLRKVHEPAAFSHLCKILLYSLRSIIHSLACISNYQMSSAAFQQLLWRIPHGAKTQNKTKNQQQKTLMAAISNTRGWHDFSSFCVFFSLILSPSLAVINQWSCRRTSAPSVPINLPPRPMCHVRVRQLAQVTSSCTGPRARLSLRQPAQARNSQDKLSAA